MSSPVAPAPPAPAIITPQPPPDLDDIISKTRTLFIIGGVICLAILSFIGWCIYQLYSLIKNWFDGNKKADAAAAKASSSLSMFNIGNATNSSNDNETYLPPANNQADDQYDTISKSIKDSFSQYKTYNEKLASYYTNVKNAPPPDTIDKGVLLPSNDDW